MDLIWTGVAAGLLGYLDYSRRQKRKGKEQLVYSGRCRAPIWALFNSLESAINVPKPCSLYPLSRYWLNLQSSDLKRGEIAAYLEFVEKVKKKTLFSRAKAVVKRFGFVWEVQAKLEATQVELQVYLFWQDLSPGKRSEFEELVVRSIVSLTRELVEKLDRIYSRKSGQNLVFDPPPVQSSPKATSWVGPPPGSIPGAPPRSSSAGLSGSAAGGRRHSNKIAFQGMSRPSKKSETEESRRILEWPSPQDYHESIQTPAVCFADSELKCGNPEADLFGMPKVASGAFASVYKFCAAQRSLAVRCFLHPLKGREARYETLCKSVEKLQLPWIVDFKYHAEGIRVGKKWYPILTMDWVEGMPLNLHLAPLCVQGKQAEIEQLRNEFRDMVLGLKCAGIAHGDFQHGNILVRDGRLVLVDYDGMYVPDLLMEKSHELGHPNYQHPGRNEDDFNETIDHFSSWVIDTALFCLREDPELWSMNYDGEESLLFHRQDFLNPEESAILLHLRQHKSEAIRKRISEFMEVIRFSAEETPALISGPAEYKARVEGLEAPDSPGSRKKNSGLPDWMDGLD